jgi:hypothetical protein
MYNLEPRRKSAAIRSVAPFLCILVMYIGITTAGQNEVIAQDKSTTITCTSDRPCEKTECINGECETTATNSSNISSTTGGTTATENKEKPESDRNSFADSLRERLSIREE